MKALILYHGDCTDGFTAAWAARKKLGDDAECAPVHYGQPPPDCAGRDLHILDFSYPRAVMEELIRQCASITVLDHHKTAAAELAGLETAGTILFDMARSGAMMAWQHYCPSEPPPPLVQYVQDRDLWKWELPKSREYSAAIASYPKDWQTWDTLAAAAPSALISDGEAILRYQAGVVENAVRKAAPALLGEHRVLCTNCTTLISEVAGRLAEGRPFGVTYFVRSDGKWIYSLRSDASGLDVSLIAKSHGGGGHPRAAGFESNGPAHKEIA